MRGPQRRPPAQFEFHTASGSVAILEKASLDDIIAQHGAQEAP